MKKQSIFYRNPLFILQVGGWAAYAITDHIGHLMYGGNHLFASLFSGLIALLITGGLALLNGKLAFSNKLAYDLLIRLLVIVPALFLGSVIWKTLFSLLHGHYSLAELPEYSLAQWLSGASFSFYLFVAWAGLYLGTKYFLESREQQQALNDAMLATKQAQLETLRYQLNPHFLFNVLNSIDVCILEGELQTSHQMVNHLSEFLRSSLKHQDRNKITLEEEIAVMQEFINIEKFRFGDSISIDIAIDDSAKSGLLPPMLLLPLVENALKFAWVQSATGKVSISATKTQRQLTISLTNSKSNEASHHSASKTGTGTGLNNTRNRLNVAYEDDASLYINETDAEYQVKLILPWISHYRVDNADDSSDN